MANTTQSRRWTRALVLAWFGVAVACGPTVMPPESSDSTGTTGQPEPLPTSDPTPTPATTPDETTAPGDTTASTDADSTGAVTSAGFVDDRDGGGPEVECSLYAQDCPPGEKCMPWANDGGGAWNATRCSPIAENPDEAGDPCTVEGNGVSGIDTCALGMMCWDVDQETNEGECAAMCTGSEFAPVCDDPDTQCFIDSSGAINLCLPVCDPVLQDCPGAEGCYPISQWFVCAAKNEGGVWMGEPGQPCEFITNCNAGTFCGDPGLNPALCTEPGFGCCTPYCDLNAPACPNDGTCEPWYEPGDEEGIGYEHVGFCANG